MSIKVMTLVWDKFQASGSELLAMLALADWCDDNGGSLYPSMQAVASKIRVSEKQARRIVQGFVNAGYLTVVGNAFGGAPGTTKQFKLDVKKIAELPLASAIKTRSTPPAGVTPPTSVTPPMEGGEGSHPCPNRAPTHGSLTVIEPSLEPSGGGERAQAPDHPHVAGNVPDGSDSEKPAVQGVPVQPVVPALRKTGLPECFAPNAAAAALACDLRVSLEVELASFADHHAAKGSVMADWQAAFRTWLRNTAKFARQDAARTAGPAETAYQRSMRERVEQVAPAIARKAPGAPAPMQAVEFFSTVNTIQAAPPRCIGSNV